MNLLIVLGVRLPTETRSYVLPSVFALDGRGKGSREKRASSLGPQGARLTPEVLLPPSRGPHVWTIPQAQHVLYVCVLSLLLWANRNLMETFW